MANAAEAKWQRYQQALLQVLGFDQLPASAAAPIYQLLIVPVFHAPCCMRLTLAAQGGELRFGLLLDRAADLFDAIWRESLPPEALAVRLAKRACLEESVHLNPALAASLRQDLAALDPASLPDIDLAARDGVSLRCDCQEGPRYHMFTMRSPTASGAPRHAALCRLFLEAARAHIQQPQIRDYLAALDRSFP